MLTNFLYQHICQQRLRLLSQSLLSVLLCLMLTVGMSSTAFAALNATITNTAGLTYTAGPATLTASVNVYANLTTANVASLNITSPATMAAGSSGPVAIKISNTGINALKAGSVLVTPPAGTTLKIPVDPYGMYTATLQPSGAWLVNVPNISVGGTYQFPGTLTVNAGTAPANVNITALYQANAVNIVSSTTVVQIQAAARTPGVITFHKLDPVSGKVVPADIYHVYSPTKSEAIYVQVEDGDQNIDPYSAQTVTVTLVDSITGDSETLTLTETGNNTGIFLGNVATSSSAATPNDGVYGFTQGSKIKGTYQDLLDSVTSVTSAALVDPFGVVFDAASGLPVDGAVVTLIDVATGQLAKVFADDGVSAYPATVISGDVARNADGTVYIDGAGNQYNFAKGNYRFPFVATGTYRLQVAPPLGYAFPSQASTASIQALAAGPFSIVSGSRGGNFVVPVGPALHIDLPVDSKGVDLFVQKTTATPVVGIGDRVAYAVSIENVHTTTASTVTLLSDVLPLGFRYQPGSVSLDGQPTAEPTILSDGRNLSFAIGSINAASSRTLNYTAVVGANAKLGVATNIAFASGNIGAAAVQSNTSQATVRIREELIRSRGFIAGTVFVDEDMNDIQDEGELGVAGIRIFMEDGRNILTDQKGRYHFDGIKPGLHVLQMDQETIAQRYQAVGLKQTRFAKNDFSQFADIRGGGLHRANFRLVNRAPEFTPVTVQHALMEEDGVVWANVDITQQGEVPLTDLTGFYTLPTGWRFVEGSASLDGIEQVPEQTPFGLVWTLDASKEKQRIRLAMRGGGESGMKEAIAYARFSSAGTQKGRTELATINIQDTLKELRDQRSFTLHLEFKTRQVTLRERELFKLKELVHSLGGLVIRELIVEGHTDNIPIAKRNRQEFADNMALSQARASTVAAYLQEQLQLDAHVVMAVGKGETEPVASNLTGKGRMKNRRVVLKVRADKISHDFSSALKNKIAQGSGIAEASWDEEEDEDVVAEVTHKVGILLPVDGMSLPQAIGAVRIVLDSGLKAELSLDGEIIGDDRIGFKLEDADTGQTTYTYIGVDFGQAGKHELSLKGLDHFGNARFSETITVVRTGELAKIKLIESGDNIADGKTPVRFRLALLDHTGVVINGGLALMQMGGDLLPLNASHQVMDLQERSQNLNVDADGWVTMAPVSMSGTHDVSLAYNQVQEHIEIYVKPETRDWIMVGFGEGVIGHNQLSGAVQPITKADEQDAFYQDGRVAFYAKGKLKGDFLLTIAYDTLAKSDIDKNSRFGDIDPNVMYTVYGDTTQQQFDGTSNEKLYLKIEKDTFYALFGDYTTGMNTTELTRYSRVFTGLKSEMHDDALGFTAFVTQTSQTMVSDDIQGNGTSGLYQLSRTNLISNTETIRIETVDRFKSEVILNSTQLTRHLDYDIDYLLGTVWFKQPVMSKDISLNPMIIRVEYESDDLTDQFTTAGGRVYIKPSENMEIGGTFVTEGRLGSSNTLSGVDVKVQLNQAIELRAEAASSENKKITGSAWKVESLLTTEDVSGKAYIRQQEDNFGLGQQSGSENATLKLGVDGQWRLDQNRSIDSSVFHQETTNTGAVRDMAHVQYNQRIDEHKLRVGLRGNRDVDGVGTATGSTLGNVGATTQITNRLSARADHEQALSQNNGVDFPTRSSIGLDYSVTEATRLSATQEWTQGQFQDTTSTRLGVHSQPWNGAQMSASYEQQLDDNGKRSFANAGLLQTWKITQALSFSASMDQTKVLTKSTPVAMNLNAPVATGGEDFTAYSVGADYRPGSWIWTNRLEYRTSDLNTHRAAELAFQGSPLDALALQFSLRWQEDNLATGALNLLSDSSLRAAWRPSYDALMLLNRFDVRRSEQTGGTFDLKSLRYINNMTANWQSTAAWRIRLNHGIKLTDETLAASTWSGLTDLLGLEWIYDLNDEWDLSLQASVLRVRHLNNEQPSAGVAVGHNMFDNFWLSMGYNVIGFYDADFAAAEYTREGVFMRFRFKFDQNSLEDMLKEN